MKLSKILEAIKSELKHSLPEPIVVVTKKERRKKMAKKKVKEQDEDRDEAYALEVIACVLEEAERAQRESDPRQLSLLDLLNP